MKNSIFKPSLILKTKQKYKGNKNTILLLLEVYSILVESKYDGTHINMEDTIESFNQIILDLKKHLDLDPQEITTLKNRIVTLVGIMSELEDMSLESVRKLHLKPEYIKTVASLQNLFQKVFDSLNIQTKIVKVKSDKTGILVPTFITDLTPTEQFIEEQISLSSAIKEKIFEKFKESLKKQDVVLQDLSDGTYALTKYSNPIAYINENIPDPKTTFKIFTNKSEIETFLQKKQLIDEAYDKLTLGEEGKLYTPNGELVTTIDFIPKQKIQASIKKYNTFIDQHNSTLQSYETKLNNEPKTVQLGDHSLKIVKVIDKNVVRPIIIEGPYTGVFLDQLVSSAGKVLGSKSVASPYFMENKQVLESMGGGRLRVKDIFKMEQSVVSNLVKDYVPNRDPLDTSVQINGSWFLLKDGRKKIFNPSLKSKIELEKMNQMTGLSIATDLEGSMKVKIFSNGGGSVVSRIDIKDSDNNDVLHLHRTLFFEGNKPLEIHNDLFTAPTCAPDGLGLRIFTQQVKAAVESKFPEITTFAARSHIFVGYYVWPKLGYGGVIPHLTRFFKQSYHEDNDRSFSGYGSEADKILEYENDEDEVDTLNDIKSRALPLFKWLDERNLLKRIKVKNVTLYEADILHIYAYKVGDRFVGQELWKEFGDEIDVSFDLSEGSLSRRILDSYVTLKAQKDGLPIQDYLNIDYEKYTNQKTLTCLVETIMDSYYENRTYQIDSLIDSTRESIKVAIKNKDNGEILEFLNRKDITEVLEVFVDYNILKNEDLVELKSFLRENNIRLPSNKFKLASDTNKPNKPEKNDAVFRGLDMGILDKIWDEISKLYG